MRYSLGDLNPKRDPSPEQKRNDHLGDSGIALSANGDEDDQLIQEHLQLIPRLGFNLEFHEILWVLYPITVIFRARDHQ